MAIESRVPLASVRVWDPDGPAAQVMVVLTSSSGGGIFTLPQSSSTAEAYRQVLLLVIRAVLTICAQVNLANVRTGDVYTGVEESTVALWGPINSVNTVLQGTKYSLLCQTSQNKGNMACIGEDTITVLADDLGSSGAGPSGGLTSDELLISVEVDCSKAEAPLIQSARFSNDALALLVNLDGPGNMYPNLDTSSFECDLLFSSGTVGMIGNAPVCQWSENQKLMILLGSGATIIPNDVVAFKAGSGSEGVRFDCPTSVLAAHGTSSLLLKPEIPLVPQVTVTGTQRVGVCDPFKLSSAVAGTGSRAVTFHWLVRPKDVPYENGEVQYDTAERLAMKAWINASFDPVVASATTRLSVQVHHLEPDHQYVFMLAATNFLQETSEFFSFGVTKLGSPIPQVCTSASQIRTLVHA